VHAVSRFRFEGSASRIEDVEGLGLRVVERGIGCVVAREVQEEKVEGLDLRVVEKHRERIAVHSRNDTDASLGHGSDGLHLGKARNLINNNCAQGGVGIRILGERLETSSAVT
jgi:hypothetical protein